jgi:hypothetical protein
VAFVLSFAIGLRSINLGLSLPHAAKGRFKAAISSRATAFGQSALLFACTSETTQPSF